MTSPDGEGIRVLVVDDEAALRRLIRERLEADGGYTVVGEAADADTALRVAEDEQPDVVLLDLLLGPEQGVEAIGSLLRVAPEAMVAVLTVLSAEEEESPALAAGAFVFYEKTMLEQLPDHLREDLALLRQALSGEEVVAPSALTRRSL